MRKLKNLFENNKRWAARTTEANPEFFKILSTNMVCFFSFRGPNFHPVSPGLAENQHTTQTTGTQVQRIW